MSESGNRVRRLITVDELASLLAVKPSWVYERTAAGSIPHVRVGRYVRFRLHEIDDWLAEGGQ